MLGLARPKIAGLAVTWIAAVAVVAVLVALGRLAAVNRGTEDTAALAVVVTQLMERTVQALYLTLASVADAHELMTPESDDPEFRGLLRRRLEDVPFARAIFIIGRDGWITHDTDYPRTPDVSLDDRPYFQAYRQNGTSMPTVWPPLLSRSGTGWFLPVTAVLSHAGEFEGLVVAALQADRFTEELRSTGLGASHFIGLFHDDGTMVASFPPQPDDVGSRFPDLPIFSAGASSSLALRASADWGIWSVPSERIVSYRKLDNAPLVVLVSIGMDEVLAGWRRLAAAATIAMLALTAVLVWQVIGFARAHVRREHERQRQAQIEKLEALGQLTGGIAHDFSNVLHIVAMNLDLLRFGRDDPAAVEQALDSSERAVRNAAAMIERLLHIARRKPLALSRLRLDEWLMAAKPLLAQAAGTDVALDIDVRAGLPEVLCDPDELDVALLNLVVNARHATSRNGHVTVRAFPCDGDEPNLPPRFVATPPRFVCLAVIDDGCGMPEDVRRRAVEPFFSTKGEAGTGLGLSQVYGLMEQIGGSIAIASSPGIGTAVHLFIPVAPPQADPAGSSASARERPAESSTS